MQTSAKARIAALESKLGIKSQPEVDDVKKKERETPKKTEWGRNSSDSPGIG